MKNPILDSSDLFIPFIRTLFVTPHANPSAASDLASSCFQLWPCGKSRGKQRCSCPRPSLLARSSYHFLPMARYWCPWTELKLYRQTDLHLNPGSPTAWPGVLQACGPGRRPPRLEEQGLVKRISMTCGYVALGSNPSPYHILAVGCRAVLRLQS